MQLTPDHIFAGRYRLITKIGMGGFSEVWKVADEMAEDRLMALKIYAPERGLDEHGIKQFRREYAITLDLNHPNLLKAHHFDVSGGSPYLLMPLCEGGSLYGKLADNGPLTEKQLAEMLVQVAGALEYLHRKDVTHQDIKPDNVLIDGDGNYMLMDFGISSRLRSTMQKSTTTAKAMTVAYAPPEKFEGMAKVGPEGDVFSLGVMLVELLTGDLPWSGMGGAYVRPDSKPIQLPGSISPALTALIQRCTAHDPAQRPAPKELKEAAERYLNTGNWAVVAQSSVRKTEVVTPKPQTEVKPKPNPEPKPEPRQAPKPTPKSEPKPGPAAATNQQNNTVWWVAGGILVLVVLVLVIAWPSGRSEEPTADNANLENEDSSWKRLTPFAEKFEGKGYLYGFQDSATYEVVIPPQFELVQEFSEGYAAVSLNGKWGFVDKSGREVVPLMYDDAWYFSEGLAKVGINGLSSFIDKTGREVIPLKYADAYSFSEGLAVVWGNNGKYGYIDKAGKIVIPLQFDRAHHFYNGLAMVSIADKAGLIDSLGNEVAPVIYDALWDFNDNRAAVAIDHKWGFIDRTGKVVVPLKYDRVSPFKESYAAVMIGEKHGFIDTTGSEVIPLKFDDVNGFSEALASVQIDYKWGYINKLGEWAIPPKFYSAWYFNEGLALVRSDNSMMGFIDKAGNEIIPMIYESAYTFQDGLAAVKSNDKWGFIDKTGNLAIPMEFDDISNYGIGFSNSGLAGVKKGTKWGVIDKRGNTIIDFSYDNIAWIMNDQIRVEENKNIYSINRKGQCVRDCP